MVGGGGLGKVWVSGDGNLQGKSMKYQECYRS